MVWFHCDGNFESSIKPNKGQSTLINYVVQPFNDYNTILSLSYCSPKRVIKLQLS